MRKRSGDGDTLLFGVHPVLEALEAETRTVDRVLVAREGRGANLGRLLRRARERGVPVSHVPRDVLARRVGARATHQGVAAVVSAAPYAVAEEVCLAAAADPRALLVLVDGVEDPRNLGAILRTAAAAGASAVLLGTAGSVGLTATVAKASAGAIERIPVAREPRPRRRLADLRSRGVAVWALDPSGGTPWDRYAGAEGPVALVVGGERSGVRRGLLEACDGAIAVPLAAGVESLNVAVALGVVLYETVRRRRAAGRERP